jgi:hypothetical protein
VISASFLFYHKTPAVEKCWTEEADPECDDGWPINGFWSWGEVWVPGYISVETWFTPAPDHFSGRVVFYSQGIMEATAAWRGLSLDGYIDGVSLMSPADIGHKVWIKFDGIWEGPFLVVDCARRGDMWPIIMHREEAVEVGWETAQRWNLEPPYPEVEVSKAYPRYDESFKLMDWFEEIVSFADKMGPRIHFRPPNEWRIDGEWMTFNNYQELHRGSIRAKVWHICRR